MACEDAISKGQRAGRKKRFFMGMPAKGLGVSDEITRQQVQSKEGGPHFPQHHVLGLHGSAPTGALPARAKMGTQKGYGRTWMKSLCGAMTSQGTLTSHGSGILLILGCQKLVRPARGGLPVLMP